MQQEEKEVLGTTSWWINRLGLYKVYSRRVMNGKLRYNSAAASSDVGLPVLSHVYPTLGASRDGKPQK